MQECCSSAEALARFFPRDSTELTEQGDMFYCKIPCWLRQTPYMRSSEEISTRVVLCIVEVWYQWGLHMSYDGPDASEVTLNDMTRLIIWIHCEIHVYISWHSLQHIAWHLYGMTYFKPRRETTGFCFKWWDCIVTQWSFELYVNVNRLCAIRYGMIRHTTISYWKYAC